jgi:hypothetical protein
VINCGTLNAGTDPDDAASPKYALYLRPDFVGRDENISVTINGGIINGNVYAFDGGVGTFKTFDITGGTFNGSFVALGDADPNPPAISGGTFSTDVSDFCKEGFICKANSDGTYGVEKNPAHGKVAKIGDAYYATLEEAFKAATEGCTIEILADVTISGKWDCRDYVANGSHSQFKESVTINGNGHTIKFTGTVSDGNWNTIFRFEENATVKNLTVDISEATGAQRVISAKKSLTVDGLSIIGSARYGIIFGEGASAEDLAAAEIVVENSTLTGTRRAISDNEGGKDVKSVVITDNALNANVYASASESIVFNNNTAAGEVDLRSYAADNVLSVEAKGNTLTAGVKNYIYAKTADAQVEFTTKYPIRGEVAYRAYIEDSASREAIKVDLQNIYAKNSVVVKLYDANGNLLITTTLKAGGFEGEYLTTNIVLAGTASGSWDTVIHAENLTVANVPTKAELWIDGALLDTFEPILGNPTDAAAYQLPAYLALDSVYKEAKIGDTYYATIADAIAAAQAGDEVFIFAGDYAQDLNINKDITVVGETTDTGYQLVAIFGRVNITADGATVKGLYVYDDETAMYQPCRAGI